MENIELVVIESLQHHTHAKVTTDASFDSLGLDSMDMVGGVVDIEARLEIIISDEALDKTTIVSELIETVKNIVSEG